jgi:hypothetical protein
MGFPEIIKAIDRETLSDTIVVTVLPTGQLHLPITS